MQNYNYKLISYKKTILFVNNEKYNCQNVPD